MESSRDESKNEPSVNSSLQGSGAQEEPSEAEVLAYLGPITERLAREIAEAEDVGAVTKLALEILSGDEGARELMAAAFNEGRADAARRMLAKGGLVAQDWSDIESEGERRMIAHEDSACSRCLHAPVCVVAQATRGGPELLVVISRCLAFIES